MLKFFKKNSKYFYSIGSFILVFMIGLMGVLIGSQFVKKTNAASTYTLLVEKTSTITIYASGKGVTPDPTQSSDNFDAYLVETGTSVSLRAVNETRIFTNWVIEGSYTAVDSNDDKTTNKRIDITPSGNLTISTEKRNARVSDYGEYMNSKFVLNVDDHLMHLYYIFKAGPTLTTFNSLTDSEKTKVFSAYDYFFEKYSDYSDYVNDAADKATFIYADGDDSDTYGELFEKIQNGYFNITSSFSLLDDAFTGIGSTNVPFEGVLCGNASGVNSTIFITSTGEEEDGDMYRGLFQQTGEYAVIRNVNIRSSFGVKQDEEKTNIATNIYAGGIAGYLDNSVISNVDVLARIAIDAASANLYVGGVAGKLEGGLDKGRNNLINGSDTTFILTTNASGTNICAGLVSGDATNVYVKEADISTTNFAISAKNTASNIHSDNTNVYLGNLFGKYTATETMPLEEINIHGTSKETITSLISSGNSYIGGLIGYLDVNAASVELGDVSITNTSGESKLSGTSVDRDSQANLLTAGLIACVDGDNLNAKPEFLDGIVEKSIDGVKRYEYNYIFNTDLLIQSVNNGRDDLGLKFGKTMATGFIARGYMNLNGSVDSEGNEIRNNILLSSGKYKTKVYATQTSTSSHDNVNQATGELKQATANNNNDQEHCLATAFYGNLDKTGISISYINVYASNYDIKAERELGSFGNGDVHAAGFVAYTDNVNFTSIGLYLNDSYIKGHSLSYEVHNVVVGINNSYIGGFIGAFNGPNSKSKLTNITFAGNYNQATGIMEGTTTKVEGIQNTRGDNDYTNENYVGGIVGRMYRADADGLTYFGSPTDEDAIISLTHENPASAFCGGAIGYIRNDGGQTINISNVDIENLTIYVGATVTDKVGSHPDIYVGGVLGAIYHGESRGIFNLDKCIVNNSDITGDGFEKVMLFIGGAVGTSCWQNASQTNISNTFVVNTNITANLYLNVDPTNGSSDLGIFSCAAGIMGRSKSTTVISNCAVIDTNIKSTYENNFGNHGKTTTVSSSGVYGNYEGGSVSISNTYSNAKLNSISTLNQHGISESGNVSSSYYVTQNAGVTTGKGVGLDFSPKPVGLKNNYNLNNTLLFGNSLPMNSEKFYIDLDDETNFAIGTTGNAIGVYANNADKASFADIWINVNGDNNKSPFYQDYDTEEKRIRAGWFKLGNLVVYNGNVATSAILSNTQYSIFDDSNEYIYQGNTEFKDTKYPYKTITSNDYVIGESGSIKTLGGTSVTIINTITVNVKSKIKQFKISLSMNPSEYYPALFDTTGKKITTNDLKHDLYGTFDYQIDGNDYIITFNPNKSISIDTSFYIGFVNADGKVYQGYTDDKDTPDTSDDVVHGGCYQFNIKHNATNFVGLIYADYSKPLNYQDITYNSNVIYKLRPNSVTKILPVFEMSNEPGVLIISELNISKVSYSFYDNTAVGTIKSNGELTTSNSGSGIIMVSYYENGISTFKYINYSVVSEVGVNYNSIGADINALTYATNENNYHMEIDLLDHYGGDPTIFNISYNQGSSFVSNQLSNADSLSLNIGGADGKVKLFASTDKATWKAIQDIDVTETYSNISNISIRGYSYFKLLNTSGEQIGLRSYTITNTSSRSTTYTYSSISGSNARFSNGANNCPITRCTQGTNGYNNVLLLYTENATVTKDKDDVMTAGWIKGKTEWDINDTKYVLDIPASFITTVAGVEGEIFIDIEFPIVYTVSFDLQSEEFNPKNTGDTFLSFKVKAGTTLGELFGSETNPTENLTKLSNAVESAKLFGFVYGGFYLIDNGYTIGAYSSSFEDLLATKPNLEIYTSYMYYARWSFLIEHIQAPGTKIEPSFDEGFLEELDPADRGDLMLNGKLTVPINISQGYVFTVEKEDGFIGEAQVNAYIVDSGAHSDKNNDGLCDSCGNDILKVGHIREVTIEKYHNNMYLYHIPRESITGYLVIVSNVTNSSIIVGKNTASVTEQILPEDGVYTFKYVVNHKKNESYIYDNDANLLNIKKNILIEFKREMYNNTGTYIDDRELPAGTVVEVYYSLYRDGILSAQTIGVYNAVGGEKKITLDAFNQWNQYVKAFDTEQTFSSFLGSNNTVSEVYYFVVTPPNGYRSNDVSGSNEIVNEIIYVGYCNQDKTTYLQGTRNDENIINRPLEGIIGGTVQKETSKQEKIYSATPSRYTLLTENNGTYQFTDIKTYHILDLTVDQAGKDSNNRLVLYDDASNDTVITSSEIKGGIRELGLKLGNNIGTVKVSGKKELSDEWTTIASFNVESEEYQYYYIDFEKYGTDYKYFQIDNISLKEIRLEAFSYSTISNAMLYEFNVADAKVTGNVYSYVNEIVGDTRHDGKTFMLELEFANTTDISNDISINVSGTIVKPLLAERDGKVRAYFNLSEILTNNTVETITFTIDSDGETLVKVKLLESSTAQKPAVSEERVVIEP